MHLESSGLSPPREGTLSYTKQLGVSSHSRWRKEEDLAILAIVHWSRVSELLPGRSMDAVRNRWVRNTKLKTKSTSDESWTNERTLNEVYMGICRRAGSEALPLSDEEASPDTDDASRFWTKEEDEALLEASQLVGLQWRKVAERLSGRTDSSVRNRYRRLVGNRPCKQHGHRGSLSRQVGGGKCDGSGRCIAPPPGANAGSRGPTYGRRACRYGRRARCPCPTRGRHAHRRGPTCGRHAHRRGPTNSRQSHRREPLASCES
jgi:hypothetical protein